MVDDSFQLFAFEAILERLEHMAVEIEGVRRADDIEFVHRMRVASRRLRSALQTFEECLPPTPDDAWKKAIRKVTQDLGEARDADVQLDFLRKFSSTLSDQQSTAGIERLMLRLRQRRQESQRRVVKALDRLEKSGVWENLRQPLRESVARARLRHVKKDSPALHQKACVTISSRLEELLSHEWCVNSPDASTEQHEMRISAKKLRYTIELFAPLFDDGLKKYHSAAKETQSLLGELHDCDVWVETLPGFIARERERTIEYYGNCEPFAAVQAGLTYLREERRQARGQLYQDFVKHWKETAEHHLWQKLHSRLESTAAKFSVGGVVGVPAESEKPAAGTSARSSGISNPKIAAPGGPEPLNTAEIWNRQS